MTHEIDRDGRTVDIWGELGPAGEHPVRTFNAARTSFTAGRQQTVVVQKGHVPRTKGSTGAPGEQQFNHAVGDLAALTAGYIEQVGHRARIVLADTPTYPPGDSFVAIHFDGSVNAQASGASVGYPDMAGAALAGRWKAAYRELGWSRGFRADNYTAGLRSYYGYSRAARSAIEARMVVEAGFGSNPGDRAWLDSARGRQACAAAICIATTGRNPLTPQPQEDDVHPKDVIKFIQAPDHPDVAKRPVWKANIVAQTLEGIETHEARVGIAEVWGLDVDVIRVHPDVVNQFRIVRGGV